VAQLAAHGLSLCIGRHFNNPSRGSWTRWERLPRSPVVTFMDAFYEAYRDGEAFLLCRENGYTQFELSLSGRTNGSLSMDSSSSRCYHIAASSSNSLNQTTLEKVLSRPLFPSNGSRRRSHRDIWSGGLYRGSMWLPWRLAALTIRPFPFGAASHRLCTGSSYYGRKYASVWPEAASFPSSQVQRKDCIRTGGYGALAGRHHCSSSVGQL